MSQEQNDHSLLARVDERLEERSNAAAQWRNEVEARLREMLAGISGIQLRLSKFEDKQQAIEDHLIRLNGVNQRKELMNRGTSVVGGGGIVAAIMAAGRALGWW